MPLARQASVRGAERSPTCPRTLAIRAVDSGPDEGEAIPKWTGCNAWKQR